MKNLSYLLIIFKNTRNRRGNMNFSKRFRFISVFIYLFIFIAVFFSFFNRDLYADWLKTDGDIGEKIWVDTSYYRYEEVLVPDGHYEEIRTRRWVDDSYTVKDGHWVTRLEKVWVEDKSVSSHTEYIYIDTSHYVTKTRPVTYWRPVSFSVLEGTDNYGWSVYSFAARYHGLRTVRYRGKEYKAHKYVIDYRPNWGGRVYAVKWVFVSEKVTAYQTYYEYVRSGYWQPITVYEVVDNSHYSYQEKRVWVDTSYTVEQGHWEDTTTQVWVDTSYYQTEKVLVRDGYYTEPLHGIVMVEKQPKYVFTRWHKDNNGEEACMDMSVSWELLDEKGLPSEKEIDRVYIYEELIRYEDKGIQKMEIFNSHVPAATSGHIDTRTFFDYSGEQGSKLHIYLYSSSGEQAHVYFMNPVNGFRSINIDSDDPGSPDLWLGGEDYGEIYF